MIAGTLDRRFTLQRRSAAKDGFGSESGTWSDVFTAWCAKVKPLGSTFIQDTNETTAETSVTIQFRYRADVEVTDRVSFEDRIWDIQSLTEIGRREGWEAGLRTRADTSQVTT